MVAGSWVRVPHTVRSPALERILVLRMLRSPVDLRWTRTTLDRSARNSCGNGKHAVAGSFRGVGRYGRLA